MVCGHVYVSAGACVAIGIDFSGAQVTDCWKPLTWVLEIELGALCPKQQYMLLTATPLLQPQKSGI